MCHLYLISEINVELGYIHKTLGTKWVISDSRPPQDNSRSRNERKLFRIAESLNLIM